MAIKQFDRYWKLTARDGNEERVIEKPLTIGFGGHRTNDLQPNELELDVYNLNEEHRNWITQKFVNIEVVAGYADSSGQIFKGAVQFGNSVREGGNWITKLVLRDGDIQWRNIFINEVFAKGSTQTQVIEKLFKELTGLPKNITDQFQVINQATQGQKDIVPVLLFPKTKPSSKKPRRRGSKEPPPLPVQVKKQQESLAKQRAKGEAIKLERANLVRGAAMAKLDLFCRSFGLMAIWDNQTLDILPADTAKANSVIEIAAGTGLIGNPEPIIDSVRKDYQTQKFVNGWAFSCQINHELAPGHLVYLDSNEYTGPLLIRKITYDALSKGGEWMNSIEGTPYEI